MWRELGSGKQLSDVLIFQIDAYENGCGSAAIPGGKWQEPPGMAALPA